MNMPLENVIKQCFGILPNFFRVASSDPAIAAKKTGAVTEEPPYFILVRRGGLEPPRDYSR